MTHFSRRRLINLISALCFAFFAPVSAKGGAGLLDEPSQGAPRILFLGDSLCQGLTYGFSRIIDPRHNALDSGCLENSGLGLTLRQRPGAQPGEYESLATFTRRQIQAHRYDLVVIMMGPSDFRIGFDNEMWPLPPASVTPGYHQQDRFIKCNYGDVTDRRAPDAWTQEYYCRARELLEVIRSQGVPVLWVGMPVMGRWDREARELETVQIRAARDGGAQWFGTRALTSEQGQYDIFVFNGHRMPFPVRRDILCSGKNLLWDRIHFSENGDVLLAQTVLEEISRHLTRPIVKQTAPTLPIISQRQSSCSAEALRLRQWMPFQNGTTAEQDPGLNFND